MYFSSTVRAGETDGASGKLVVAERDLARTRLRLRR